MKGDFTRFTFRPEKRYTSVLMQQGRLQLDADWNEQMNILSHLNETQARDMIGETSGTSESDGGFQLQPITDGADFIIQPGKYYINGNLTQLNEGSSIRVIRRTDDTVLVPVWVVDGQALAKDQWVEIRGRLFKVIEARADQRTLKLQAQDNLPLPSPASNDNPVLFMRRLTTFKTQAEFSVPPQKSEGIHIVYLDTWERHITAVDDPELREVALNGADTTTRLQTVTQVKLLPVKTDLQPLKPQLETQLAQPTSTASDNTSANTSTQGTASLKEKPSLTTLTNLPEWQQLLNRPVVMTALTALDPEAQGTTVQYTGNENHLYRIEIHKGGKLDEATFKWSRDNGSIVSVVERIEGNVIRVKGTIQEEFKRFDGNQSSRSPEALPWIEIIDAARELNNEPGILVRVMGTKPPNQILFDLSQVQGNDIPKATPDEAEQRKLKVRRWDGKGIVKKSRQVLEKGIQVQFDVLPNNEAPSSDAFQTGDVWLIPARETGTIEWSTDHQGTTVRLGVPLPQAPMGINHRFGILGLVKWNKNGTFESAIENDTAWEKVDQRPLFPPLINCFDKKTGFIDGNFGIGVKPKARLHVQGNVLQTAKGKIESQGRDLTKIVIREVEPKTTELSKGYTLTINGKTSLVTDVDANGVLTVTPAFAEANLPQPDTVTQFQYQQPVVRFDTSDTQPQFFLSLAGNIGIGTFLPTAKLEVKGSTETPSALHVKSANDNSLLHIQNDGKVGVGVAAPQAALDVKGSLKLATGAPAHPGFLQIQPQDGASIKFISSSGYELDQKVTVVAGGVTVVSGGATINGATAITGDTTVAGKATVNGDTALNGTVRIERVSALGGFLQIQPQNSSEPVLFTSNSSYQFDRGIAITTEGLTVTAGGARITGATTVAGDTTITGKVTLKKASNTQQIVAVDEKVTITGDVQINSGKLRIGTFEITEDGFSQDSPATLKNGLTVKKNGIQVESGDVTIDTGKLKLGTFEISNGSGRTPQFAQPVMFGDRITIAKNGADITGNITLRPNPDQTLNPNLVGVSLPKRSLAIHSGNVPLLLLAPPQSDLNKPVRLSVAGSAAIGARYVNETELVNLPIENGLLVEGEVGIGVLDGNPPLAKLEVRSNSDSEEFALNVTKNDPPHHPLFYVKNDGQVGIATDTLNPTFNNAIPQAARDATKLYVKGNAYVDGNVFAQKVGGVEITSRGDFIQLSSRTLKQNIASLSSQEATDLLKSINPVKFSYTAVEDRTLHAGFIAEEMPFLLTSSDQHGVRVLDTVAVLTRVVKDQQTLLGSLVRIVKQQQGTIATLTDRIHKLEKPGE